MALHEIVGHRTHPGNLPDEFAPTYWDKAMLPWPEEGAGEFFTLSTKNVADVYCSRRRRVSFIVLCVSAVTTVVLCNVVCLFNYVTV